MRPAVAAAGSRLPLQARYGTCIWKDDEYARARGPDMTTFDDRERAFESKYAHDAEMQFKAEARRNKLVGLWAAGLMGKSGDAAAEYAMSVVHADFHEAGIEDVVRKVAGDLGGKASADEVRAKMAELLPVAKAQLMEEN
mgnify:CR=1 FL=1